MTSFSERQGYRPDRSRLHQFEEMDDRLRNAIWNFLWKKYFTDGFGRNAARLLSEVWTDVIGKPLDSILLLGRADSEKARRLIRNWYFEASWHEVYDVLEHILSNSTIEVYRDEANAILRREGAAYRFIGGVIAPITNVDEIAEVEDVLQHKGPFDVASQHIRQAVTLLSDRENPDARNAIKESISAVDSAVGAASGDPKLGVVKGIRNLGMHSQLEQAWINMYNWTSDEDGIRHGAKETPQVGLAEARYMVVACSAFVNYLIAKYAERG